MASRKNGVVLITKTRIDIYIPDLQDILHFVFPENLVLDMEVVSRQDLSEQVSIFLQQNKISGVEFICLVYDELLFSKEFKNVPIDQQAEDKKNFTSSIPFEYTLIKEIPSKETTLVIATNRVLIESIMQGIQKSENMVSYVSISYIVLGEMDMTGGLTPQMGDIALKKSDQVKHSNLLGEEKYLTPIQQDNAANLPFYKNPKNRRSIILVGVFGVLMIILVFVIINTNAANNVPVDSQITQPAEEQLAPTKAQEFISDAAFAKIQIRTNDLERFSEIQSSLGDLNFQLIELDTSSTSVVPNTTIIFDSSLSPSLQQNITQIIQTFDESTTTQVSSIGTHHAVIVLGQNN